jgi:excisionase family DNA binding protein
VSIGGPGGLEYTRACYLRRISDAAGRSVTFDYREKVYTDTVREYEPPHVRQPTEPAAYQDRYETRYLDAIRAAQLVDGAERELFSVGFTYSVDNVSDAVGDPIYLFKRFLRGITLVNADGKLVPGLRFTYYDGSEAPDAHRGALEAMTYPGGAVATYRYRKVAMAGTDLALSVTRDESGGGIPRVFFGPNYAVLARYDVNAGRRLALNLYDWNGSWIASTPLATNLAGDVDLSTLAVVTQDDFLVLSFRMTGQATGDEIVTYVVRRTFGTFGHWDAQRLAMPTLKTTDSTFQVDAGNAFVAAAATDIRTVYRYVWDPRNKVWDARHVTLPTAGEFLLRASDHFFTLGRRQTPVSEAPPAAWRLAARVPLVAIDSRCRPGVVRRGARQAVGWRSGSSGRGGRMRETPIGLFVGHDAPPDGGELLRPAEVCARLKVSRAWVYRAAADGRLPSLRLGGPDGPLRFEPAALDAWIERCRAAWRPGDTGAATLRRVALGRLTTRVSRAARIRASVSATPAARNCSSRWP